MRNYLFSITVHLILLILLMSWWIKDPVPEKPIDYVVIVEFDNQNEVKRSPADETKPVKKSPVKVPELKVKTKSDQKVEKPKDKVRKPSEAKKQTLHTSQKPTEFAKSPEVKVAEVTKEIVPNSVKPKDELAKKIAQEEAKHLETKNSFKSLLNQSFKQASSSTDPVSEEDFDETPAGSPATSNSQLPSMIMNGDLSKRKVLRVPQIQDDSQKQGRAVVKICVNAGGEVVSSDYTQMGSTTSDPYLVKLATDGAFQYLFSPSPVQLECGRVIIEFKLK